MRYGGCRYLLYKRWDFAPNGRTEEQKEALDAGTALFKAANFHHWGTQPELVERVQKFLVESFPSYRPSQYGERSSEVINALCWEVRNGAALIVRAAPAYIAHDGFVPARDDYAAYDKDIAERASSYAARSKAYSEDLQAYNKAIDDRIAWESRSSLKPFRHIESVTEAGERNRAAWAALGGLASLGSAALSIAASSLPSIKDGAPYLGDRSDTGISSTPLGDAAPFELGDMPSFGDSFDIAKTPNEGEPGTWYTNPGSGQMRLYGDTGAPVVDLDFDHRHLGMQPHAHNWTGKSRAKGLDVVPFSPWSR
jgi:hypothetical protein